MSKQRLKEKLHGRFISEQGLRNLAEYKYSGEDKSIIYNYFVNPLAKALCNCLPKWISPNVLTLLGLLCSAAAYVILGSHIPHFTESAPRWVYYTAAALVFLYLMLDAMDGTQARRTNMASPMGELFDHLCDSLSLTLCVMLVAATMRLGAHEAFFFLITFFVPFYASHWDNYNTGKLEMGRFGGPTDLLVMLIGVLVATGIAGSGFWVYSFSILGRNFHVNHVAVIVVAAGSAISTITYIVHLFRNKPQSTTKREALMQLIPYCAFLLICFGFLASPYILKMYAHQFMLCVGCSNAYLLARLIVVRVTKEPIPRFHIILVFLFLSLVISTFSLSPIFPWNKGSTPPSDSTLNYVILGVLLAYVFSQWLFFFSAAVRQLSKFLRMPVFTVKDDGEKDRLIQSEHASPYGSAEVILCGGGVLQEYFLKKLREFKLVFTLQIQLRMMMLAEAVVIGFFVLCHVAILSSSSPLAIYTSPIHQFHLFQPIFTIYDSIATGITPSILNFAGLVLITGEIVLLGYHFLKFFAKLAWIVLIIAAILPLCQLFLGSSWDTLVHQFNETIAAMSKDYI